MTAADRSIRKFLLERIPDGSAALDVGCGNGWATLLISRERPRCVVHGADSDAAALRRLSQKLRRLWKHRTTRCYLCSAEKLAGFFGTRQYDVAVSVHALHHYEKPYEALQNVQRVLRPGGRLLIAEFDPFYGETLDDCPRFSVEKITWLCKDAGFRLVSAVRKRPGILLVDASI